MFRFILNFDWDTFFHKFRYHAMNLFTALLFVIAFAYGGILLVGLFHLSGVVASYLLDIITITICLLAYFLLFYKNDLVRRAHDYKYDNKKIHRFLCLLFIIVWYASQNFSLWYYYHFGDASFDAYKDISSAFGYIVGFVFTVIVAPIAEELLCRGIVYNYFRRSIYWVVSILITSLLFAFLHGTVVHLFVGTMEGFVFNLAYEMTGDLRVNISFHMFSNLLTYFPFLVLLMPYNSTILTVAFMVVSVAFIVIGILLSRRYRTKLLINEKKNENEP